MRRNGRFNHGVATMAVAAFILALLLQSCRAQPQTTNNDASYSNPSPYRYTRFTPSMAVVLAIFILVVFLLSFMPFCIHNAAAARVAIDLSSRRGQRGLDPSILCTFPTFAYSEVISHKVGRGTLECAVCLNEFSEEETLKLLPNCDHIFHLDCIDVWLDLHSTCPVCRASPEEAFEATRSVQTAPEASLIEANSNEAENPALLRSVSLTISEPEVVEGRESSNHLQAPQTRSWSMRLIFFFFSKFPRSNSTGHFVVGPGENVDRFTLKLPSEIRNRIMNRMLNRSASALVLPTESSFRKEYRTGVEDWSGRVRHSGSMDGAVENRWWFGMGSNTNGFGSRSDGSGSEENTSTRPVV